jgi:sugar lactone lactonase YvrE
VASIHPGGNLDGACSDSAGNVFVTNWTQVLEYQHGGISPVATLSLPGNQAAGCSVDRKVSARLRPRIARDLCATARDSSRATRTCQALLSNLVFVGSIDSQIATVFSLR